MLELYYNFFYEFCENDKYEEMEMDTDSLYLALAETNLYDCIQEDKKEVWEFLRSEDCNDNFVADYSGNFFPRAVKSTRNTTRENRVFSRRNSGVQKCCVSVARPIVAMMPSRTSIISAAKVSTSEHLRTAVMGPWPSIKKC